MSQCKTCKLWMPVEQSGQGLCRRFPPPTLVNINGDNTWVFPAMKPDGWCGEWQPKTVN